MKRMSILLLTFLLIGTYLFAQPSTETLPSEGTEKKLYHRYFKTGQPPPRPRRY